MEKRKDRLNEISIYINSSNREEAFRTTKQMPRSWKDICFIVVLNNQFKKYKKQFPGHNIIKLPKGMPKLLAPQRQWSIDNCVTKYIFIMDDDLTFYTRDEENKLIKSSPEQMEAMMDRTLYHLRKEGADLVGISEQNGNNRVLDEYQDTTRVTRCYAYNVEKAREIGLKVDENPKMGKDDFQTVLCFLNNGCLTRTLYNFAQDHIATNSPGGCADYRNAEFFDTAARLFNEKYPHCTKIVKRKVKTNPVWESLGFVPDEDKNITRTEIMIYWKKAYEVGLKRKSNKNIISFFK